MKSLLAYSGLTTKVKAMESRLITDAQFREMAAMDYVAEAVEYLKQQPAYKDIFSDLDDDTPHRGKIEQLLNLSKYRDFAKLYRFSNLSQRKFLDLYFMHYEISILKKCLRNAIDHRKFELDLSMFQEFFERHTKLDLIKLSESQDLADFISNLQGSPYYDLLSHLDDAKTPTLFDYEMNLDLLYFKAIWKNKGKRLSKTEQKILSECFGSKLDLLNIQWIYRSKKFYNLPASDIYALLIPIHYRLKNEQVTNMAEAGSLEEFYTALQSTYYGSMPLANLAEKPNLEDLTERILFKIYSISRRRNPYSIACLNSYLYFKESELSKIITTLEGIRYGVDVNDIISYADKK